MKSKSIIITAMLLIAVLVSSCFMSTTVAYYKSFYGSKTSSARIAKWGIDEAASITFDLFELAYTNGTLKVASSATADEIIAPGITNSSSCTFAVPSEAPEVSYRFIYTADVSVDDAIINSSGLVLKINNETVNFKGTLTGIDAGSSAIFAAGEKPNSSSISVPVEWSWPDRTTDSGIASDTALGNLTTGNTIQVTVKATAVQVLSDN